MISKIIRSVTGPKKVDQILETFNQCVRDLESSAAGHEEIAHHHNNQARIHVGHAYLATEEANRARKVSEKIQALTS